VDPLARVRWGRQFSQATAPLVTMLTQIAEKLGVPGEALLEHLPFSSTDLVEIRRSMGQQPSEQMQNTDDAVVTETAVD